MTGTATETRFQGFAIPTGINFSSLQFAKKADGTGSIKGLRVFRSGTFKDSMGFQRTWLPEQIEMMVSNFKLLRDRGILPNVPVRDGHPGLFGSGGTVGGYFSDVRSEKDGEFSYLVADLDLTEPEFVGKWERGTFRGRSLEVGMYEDNNEVSYWPTIMGVAFVDIPAVEGLYSNAQSPQGQKDRGHFFQILMDNDKETAPVGDENKNDQGGTQPSGTQPTTDNGGTNQPPAAPPAPPSTDPNNNGGAPASGSGENPTSQNSNPATGQFTFTINGVPTSDFGAVQRHIAVLEQFRKDTNESARKDFVSGLATSNKITAAQVESLTTLALGLSDEQFGAFRASYEATQPLSLLSKHAGSEGTPPAPSNAPSKEDEIAVLEETIAMHKRAGATEDQIAKTASFKRLQALQSA